MPILKLEFRSPLAISIPAMHFEARSPSLPTRYVLRPCHKSKLVCTIMHGLLYVPTPMRRDCERVEGGMDCLLLLLANGSMWRDS